MVVKLMALFISVENKTKKCHLWYISSLHGNLVVLQSWVTFHCVAAEIRRREDWVLHLAC